MTDERLTMGEAARAADRSEATIRRWIRQGKLTRYEAPAPAHGGSAPVLLDRAELHALLVVEAKQPHEPRADSPTNPPATPPPGDGVSTGDGLRVELERTRGLLALAELRAELEGERAARRAAETLAADLRSDRDAWRDRADAATAEARALRAALGLPWWRRLLGAAPPALTDGG